MAANAGSVYAELILDMSKYEENLKKAENQMNTFSKKLKKTGKGMEKAGKSLSKYVTAPVVAVGTLSTKAAIDFESAFAGVRKTVDASEKEFAALEKGIRDMSKRMPQSASEIAKVAESAGQLGIETENILGFTETMVMLGDATNLSSDQAATALARLANITGMPQTEFSRLGSSVVALGNNLATTESEIVEMGLRLAGTGTQVGLTEDQILALAGAMSSVGINAEAGGSSMSRVMQKINTQVLSGGSKLQNFAKVAGMSADEFSKAWKEKPAEAILAFIKGLDNVNKSGGDVTSTLKDLGINSVQEIDTLLRLAGASDVLTDALGISADAWEENTALQKEAEQRYQTTASQLQIAKNHLQDAAITIGEIMIPHLVNFAKKIKNLAEWFKNLNPETQKTIIKMAALAAAIGPVLSIGGKLAGGVSSIIGLFGKFKAASTVATAATGATVKGFSLAGAAAKAGALLLNPWVLGIAGAGAVTYGLYKHLSQDAIPAIDLFGEGVSESTQKAVGGFMELNEQATLALNQLSWSGQEVTQEMTTNITNNFSQMAQQVQAGLDSHYQESLGKMQNFINNSTSLSKEEQEQILANMQQGYENKKQAIADGEARIKEILTTASNEKRALTKEEQEEINTIQQKMVDTGIQVLSENEVEAKAIMERMKQQAGEISARQAAEVVKNSLKQKDETIKAADEQYNEVVKEIIRQRDEAGTITAEQADKLIKEAKRQRDETVNKAEEMHNQVVEQAKKQAGEHVNEVDWETGEIKSKWEVMRDDTIQKAKEIKKDVVNKWEEIRKSTAEKWGNVKKSVSGSIKEVKKKVSEGINKIKEWNRTNVKEKVFSIINKIKNVVSTVREKIGHNARGTNYWRGGLTWVGEQGPELIELPRGSKIYSNQKSMEMININEERLANTIIRGLKAAGLSKPAIINLNGRAVGKGIVRIIDTELEHYNTEDLIGRGQLEW